MTAASQKLAAFAAEQAKKWGAVAVSNDPPPVIVPTGVFSLDWALRVGGWQLGRIYELVGPKDTCKSWLAIRAMAQHRLMFPDRGVCYVNIENTFQKSWATLNGLDCSDEAVLAGTWMPRNAGTSEQASDLARDVIASGLASCLVIDSIGAMESNRVLEKDAEKGADDSRRNSSIITKLTKALATHARQQQCTVLLVNQPRANQTGFGGDISAGPKAMQHSTTAQLKMSTPGEDGSIRKASPNGYEEIIGRRFRASIPRMKNGIPGRRGEWFVMNRETDKFGPPGLDLADDAVGVGVRLGAIKQGGAMYTLPTGQKIKSRASVVEVLRSDPEALAAVRGALKFDDPIMDPLEEST